MQEAHRLDLGRRHRSVNLDSHARLGLGFSSGWIFDDDISAKEGWAMDDF